MSHQLLFSSSRIPACLSHLLSVFFFQPLLRLPPPPPLVCIPPLGALKPVCLDSWAVARHVILSVVSTQGREEILWNPAELLEVVELADLFEICG